MATVTITGGTGDAGALGDNRPWKLWAAVYQSDGNGGVITTCDDRQSNLLRPVAGVLTFEVEAGIAAYLETPDKRRYLVTMPDTDASLWSVIENSIPPASILESDAIGLRGRPVDDVQQDGSEIQFYVNEVPIGEPVVLPHGEGLIDSVVAGNNIDVDNSDPANPVVSVEPLTADDITETTTKKWLSNTERTKLSGITDGAQPTSTSLVDAAGAVMNSDTSTAAMAFVVDEDNMTSDLATKVPTQQSVRAFVLTKISDLIGAAPAELDTWIELVAAIQDNEDALAGVVSALALKAAIADVVALAGTQTITGQKTFSTKPIANHIEVRPAAPGGSASVFLKNTGGAAYEFFTSDGGSWGLYDQVTGRVIFAVDPNCPADALKISTGSISTVLPLDMNSHKITELTPGTAGTDAVNKDQLDTKQAASATLSGIAASSIPTGGYRVVLSQDGGATWTAFGTTSLGRTLLALADAAAGRTALDVPAASRAVSTQHSLTGGGDLTADRTLSLVGDTAAPGNTKLYGTNSSGVRGWYDQPGGAVSISVSGTYAARPAASVAGRLFYCTDNGNVYRDNGTSWDLVSIAGSGMPGTEPPSASWTTTTLGSATIGADKGGRLVTVPTASGINLRGEYQTLSPTSNYTVTAYIESTAVGNVDFWRSGILLRDGSGKYISFGHGGDLAAKASIAAVKYSSESAATATYDVVSIANLSARPNWFRIRDNGTTRYFEYSLNGIDWAELANSLRTDFLTATQVGWGASNSTGKPGYCRLHSFSVT